MQLMAHSKTLTETKLDCSDHVLKNVRFIDALQLNSGSENYTIVKQRMHYVIIWNRSVEKDQ